jgi:hypothetical protein
MLVPGDGAKGCLETLCFEALKEKYASEATCVEALIDCCSTKLADWGIEKRDKTRLQSLVAVTYKPNPSRTTRLLFSKFKNHPPAIDIEAQCFKAIAEDVRAFCVRVGVS